MVFRSRSNPFSRRKSTSAGNFHNRPLLHVLAPGQSPDDFEDPLEYNFRENDVVISRAELDLRRAVQNLMIHTRLTVNSLEVLTALELPGNTAALFWAVRLLLDDSLPGEMSQTHLIRKRDHDSRLLYQALASTDLDQWYVIMVDKASIEALPRGIQFPPGHPVVQRYYRQHPLPIKQRLYLPTANFFSGLFQERKQELIRLLITLGANRIELHDRSQPSTPAEVLVYPGRRWQAGVGFNLADYAWLPYEPSWQRVLSERSAGLIPIVTLDLTVDINGMLTAQLAALKNLISQLDSVETLDGDRLDRDYLKPLRVTATFPA